MIARRIADSRFEKRSQLFLRVHNERLARCQPPLGVEVAVAAGVNVAVGIGVNVAVALAVGVGVAVGSGVGVNVAVTVGLRCLS